METTEQMHPISAPQVFLFCHLATQACAAIALSTFWILGPTKYFDSTTFYLSIALLAVMASAAFIACFLRAHVLDMLLGGLYLFVVIRLVHFATSPASVALPVDELSIQEINYGLGQAIGLIASFIIGIAAPFWNSERRARPGFSLDLPEHVFKFLLLAFFLLLSVEAVIYGSPETSGVGLALFEKQDLPAIVKILLCLVAADAFLFVLIYIFLVSPVSTAPLPWRRYAPWALVLGAIVSYIWAGSVMGSRGTGLRVALYAIAICLVVTPWTKQAVGKTMLVVAAALIISVLLTPLANTSRDRLAGVDVGKEGFGDTVVRLVNRINYADYLLVTLSREPNPECADRYLNWPYYFKNTVNFLAPGDPYVEARLSSSNAFGICYRHATEETMPRYHSEVWTLPGLANIMYPDHVLLVCALLGLMLGAISRSLRALASTYGTIIYAFWVWCFPFSIFFTMGFDHTVNLYIVTALRLALPLLLVGFLSRARFGLAPRRRQGTGGAAPADRPDQRAALTGWNSAP